MFLFILLITFFLNYSPILASERNIFGLHLTQTQDIEKAAKIINSSDGDWGWATIVIRLDQLDKNAWQEFFNKCRKLHINPIIRLSTLMENGYWKKPSLSDIDTLANFLNSLNWPTTKQHITLFNEINHASEWGGAVDIKNFTDISIYSYQKFKSLNQNFIILSSGLDLAAPDKGDQYKSASTVYKEIYNYRPEYYDNIDAIASHSYPNHGFVGTPNESGQHSIRGYQWELSFIKSLGINKTYPIFITETGWPHREGESKNNQFYTADTSAKFLATALSIWQKDNQIVAVTPFIFNYPYAPFDHFSWVDKAENILPAYQQIIDLSKNKNSPDQINSYQLVSNHLPFILITDTVYLGKIILKNTGQTIWGEKNFCLNPQSTQNVTIDAVCTSNGFVEPGQIKEFDYKINIKNIPEFKDKTYISWDGLPPLEITPISGSGTIYSPKTTIKEKLFQYIQSWFI